MQKRIVVLGGAGFIGTHLCLRLLADGNEVFCVDVRDAAGSSLLRDVLRHPVFHAVRHNIVHGFGIRCDEIYNLASPSRVCYDKALPVEALQVCMIGTINTLDTARDEHARVLFASSGEMGNTRPAAAEGCGCAHTLMEGKTGSRSPAPRLPRGVRRRHTHRTHLQHLWQRSRPDGSAAGDEERRGGAA